MRFRRTGNKAESIRPQMAPMIDVVFLLLIFFMLTLRVLPQEGDFDFQIPLGSGGGELQQIRVELVANADGSLKQVHCNHQSLGTGEDALKQLHKKVQSAVAYRPGTGHVLNKDVSVEIDADYVLDYRHTLKAVSACSAVLEKTRDGNARRVPLVETVRFAPPDH